ncbi:MAG TPA: DUF4405 domain-containing protein [Acidobacteriota bacterium]|nr:DUF4405 domain-containing protein [Acidobacteriota bacterium]HNT16321.1 DUF4405 domain-containing protein [Acidobacteriota bacterium]
MAIEDSGKRKRNLNFIIDSVAFVILMVMTSTGVLMRYFLPPGRCDKRHTMLGLQRHEWGDLHFWLALVFFSLMAVHIYLHWKWIVGVVTGKPKEGSGMRAAMGLFGLVMVVALSAAPFFFPVKVAEAPGYSASELASVPVTASMTLAEAAKASGVPLDDLMTELDIPETVQPERKLGDACAEYGFSMDEVREVVLQYKGVKPAGLKGSYCGN